MAQVVSLSDWLKAGTAGKRCVAALGSFDGVHRGHVALLSLAAAKAQELGVVSVAFTFDNLPREVLQPDAAPQLLTPPCTRLALLGEHAQTVVTAPFNSAMANLSPADFVARILVQALGCVHAVVGYNYSFGRGASGGALELLQLAEPYGVGVSIVPPVYHAGVQVSSTVIRQLVSSGAVEEAATLLGRPFALEGEVVSGDARGRLLGFPTANVARHPRQLLPAEGVYITEFYRTADANRVGAAVTAVSQRPTFGGGEVTVESFILDYAGDLYGAAVSIHFLRRLRGIVRFANAQELQTQIKHDVEAARAHFALTRLQP